MALGQNFPELVHMLLQLNHVDGLDGAVAIGRAGSQIFEALRLDVTLGMHAVHFRLRVSAFFVTA